jgi:hypothetical protein
VFHGALFSQEDSLSISKNFYSIEASYFYGNIIEHNPDVSHLILGHPQGFSATFNKKTFGEKAWERFYNYPDVGLTFIYHDARSPNLGKQYSINGHFNFYALKRKLVFTVGQGITYVSDPYDAVTNFNNNAYGTSLLTSMLVKLTYRKNHILGNLGVHAGIEFIHFSNGNFKAPNTSTNTVAATVGVHYDVDAQRIPSYVPRKEKDSAAAYKEPIKYNLVFRSGMNESNVIGSGQFPFYVVSAYADKRLNYKSKIQAGVDFFFMKFLDEYIKYRAIAFPENGGTGDEDYKQVGIFVGHELLISKTAFVSQLGYYVYYPYDFEGRVYNRLGLKRYMLQDQFFATIAVKSIWAKAEAIEFGIGIRI